MAAARREGLVIRVTGGEVWVETDGRTEPFVLRGRFKKERGFQVVAGDRVTVSGRGGDGSGAIEAVAPRRSWLSRYVGGRVSGERVIVANVDRVLLVVTLRSPRINYRFLDRVLVSAERGHTPATICINKMDLVKKTADVDALSDLYERVGYPVLRASAKTGEGLERLVELIAGGIYAFLGQSGVGKSALLNRIDPDLNLRVGGVAHKTGRGRHTTTYSQLFPMKGGYVADTPGMQTFGFPGDAPAELSPCFPEFRERSERCRFQPCTHSHEPGCAVKDALEAGDIAASRYESYLSMLSEVEKRAEERW